jgi:hypothetical protein
MLTTNRYKSSKTNFVSPGKCIATAYSCATYQRSPLSSLVSDALSIQSIGSTRYISEMLNDAEAWSSALRSSTMRGEFSVPVSVGLKVLDKDPWQDMI